MEGSVGHQDTRRPGSFKVITVVTVGSEKVVREDWFEPLALKKPLALKGSTS